MPATLDVPRVIRPQSGPQEDFLASSADIAIAGGAAGVGKTWGLLLELVRNIENKDFGAVIFRRQSTQIGNEGGLWDESTKLYPLLRAVPKPSAFEWLFPSGAKCKFSHMEYEKDRTAWDGSQIPFIGFDQLEHFLAGQFWYMLSRNRSMCGVRPYIRATCNPVPEDDPVGGWLNTLIAWWIDQETGYPIWERSGVLRWFVRIGDVIEWGDSADELRQRFAGYPPEDIQPKSLTFIPGKLEHNPALLKANPEYRASLLALPLVERERLLGGNWKIRPAAGKVFNRGWFEIVDVAPAQVRRCRGWDKAGTEGAGDWSAGVRVAQSKGVYYIEDVIKGQWSALQRNAVMKQKAEADGLETQIDIEQEPGSSGKESAERSIRELAGYRVSARPSTGDKVTRAGGLSAQAEAGNVKLVRGAWNEDYLNELHNFPDGAHDDQVDASSLSFNRLSLNVSLHLWGGDDAAPKTLAELQQIDEERIAEAARVVDEAVLSGGDVWFHGGH